MAIKVLILDDDKAVRNLLCRVVRESFSDVIHITEAGDLETARRLIAMKGDARCLDGVDPFKLVLIDLQLLDGDGVELLTELAAYPATKIVIARNSDDYQVFRALKFGVDGYLPVRDSFEALVDELQKIVHGQPPLSAAIARLLLTHFRASTATGAAPLNAVIQIGRPSPPGRNPTRGHALLTPREGEVLVYLSKGFTIKEIANLIGIKWFAVNDQVKSIYRKLLRGPDDDDGALENFNAPKPLGGAPQTAEWPPDLPGSGIGFETAGQTERSQS